MTWICDEVKQLDLLLNEYLGTTKLIKDVKTKKISQPGENYGSIMYSLDVTVEDKQNKHEETIHTVAKVLPQGELIRQIFNIQTTYKNEMAFYKVIVPTMLYFQKELDIQKPIDCFAKCYAVRKNLLENSDVIDDDAVLLLENLKTAGFINIDKVKGFDLETAEMVLRSLAQFHGISLALKIKKPEVFEKKIKMHCDDYYIAVGEMPLMVPTIQLLLNENEEIKEQILPKVVGWEGAKRIPKESIFNTLVHDDLWTNNTMQKFKNGKPVENKLVDFQIIAYGSPARDLFFFYGLAFLWLS
ncbi:unnamed protein product [Psylliodes chrysocephalus]|uniref:CHK kinase-like domain-containing protein n=1 Tax=Psylliodes chrysocephalus TaxID=3402493 RepID=A0A9P0D6R0_9CUCU|nr:unnamed protein product [Psylliodes chrysocephala]